MQGKPRAVCTDIMTIRPSIFYVFLQFRITYFQSFLQKIKYSNDKTIQNDSMTSSVMKYVLLDAGCIRITNLLIIYLRFHNLESVSVRDFEPISAVASFRRGNKCQFQSVSNKSGFTDCIKTMVRTAVADSQFLW